MSTPITLTGAYTCTHHNDKQRTECPVCLVTQLRAELSDQAARFHDEIVSRQGTVRANQELDLKERDQLRTALAAERARLDWLLEDNVTRFENSCFDRADIDNDMKEGAK